MNKSIFISLSLLLSITILSCKSDTTPRIKAGADECYNCRMVITETNQACGFFRDDKFVSYCSPSCLIADYDYFRKENSVPGSHVFFADYTSRQLIQADSTRFLFTKSVPTVMNSGVLTFRKEEEARSFIKQQDEFISNWVKFRVIAGKPDKIVDIKLSENRLIPNKLVFNKNELVQINIEKTGAVSEQDLYIKGYEYVGGIRIFEDKTEISLRFIADKPGPDFPIMLKGNKAPLGTMKVLGSHTSDD
jgi:hypothetical protein